MTVGTLVAGRLTSKLLPLAVLLGTVVAGIGIALAGLSPHLWLAVAAYGIGGFGDGVEVVALRSLLNERAPAPVAGRVFTAYTAITVGAASLGMAAAAPLVAVFGTRATSHSSGLRERRGRVGLARRAHRALDVPYGHSVVLTPAALRAGAALGGCARSSSNVGGVSEHPARRRATREEPGVERTRRRHLAHAGDRGAVPLLER